MITHIQIVMLDAEGHIVIDELELLLVLPLLLSSLWCMSELLVWLMLPLLWSAAAAE
jgi:hypothetical protein